MPFVSSKQRAYLYSQKPEIAKKFAKHSKPTNIEKAKYALKGYG